jgi:hypothetical protein
LGQGDGVKRGQDPLPRDDRMCLTTRRPRPQSQTRPA